MRARVGQLGVALVLLLAVTTLPGLATTARAAQDCVPVLAPVDPEAVPSAVCLAASLDSWRSAGLMAIGQQLDLPRRGQPGAPLRALRPLLPKVIGFDLEELITAREYFDDDPVPYLTRLARSGAVLTATWHAPNPVTGGDYADTSWTSVADLLDPDSEASAVFWPRYERALRQLERLQFRGVPVILKPLHEAGGGWFWWGGQQPAVYLRLFSEFQSRAASAGVHNILWAYAAAPQNRRGILDPLSLMPRAIDLAGLDVYDDERHDTVDRLPLADFRRMARVAPRMALTEVGPRLSMDGRWNPRVITDTLRKHGLYASYAMLWRDGPNARYMHQISSLTGGRQWLAGCPGGLCPLTP